MGSHIPKQYMDLKGKPLLIHTVDRFLQFDPRMKVVLVMASGHRKFWDVISISYDHTSDIVVAPGGRTRYDSVKSGLQFIDNGLIVGIHDAVRPFVSLDTIKRCYSTAEKNGSAIPVIEMDESVRMVDSPDESTHMDRSKLRRVQTPQVFRSEMIKKAYDQIHHRDFTDDASVFESLFDQVTLVEGNRENIKITTPEDLQLATSIMGTGS
jgi:2-C-methyl-D-erythritol 4-phosphate cytidylyltransferase